MKWSELPTRPSPRVLRQFAGGWLVLFGCLAAHQAWARGHPQTGLALGVVAVVVGAAGLLRPATVRWLFVGSTLLAFPVGWLVSQLMLAALFYGVITPVALFFRWKGRDLLGRRPPAGKSSLWVAKEPPQDPRRYFRQY